MFQETTPYPLYCPFGCRHNVYKLSLSLYWEVQFFQLKGTLNLFKMVLFPARHINQAFIF